MEHQLLSPAFAESNIPIVLAANDYYVPYMTVMMRSVMRHASPENNYDIVILHSGITQDHQTEIREEFSENSNLSIRFVLMEPLFASIELPTHFHITRETYYRLLIKDILVGYDKVLYLDSDLVLCADAAELYGIDIGSKLLAAVADIESAAIYNHINDHRRENIHSLGLSDPFCYFNAGVLILNLQAFRQRYTTRQILDLVSSRNWLFMDQDILNFMCAGDYYPLPASWNVMLNWETREDNGEKLLSAAPEALYTAYLTAREAPKLIHFAGIRKPWNDFSCDLSRHFWEYARQTGVYELLLERRFTQIVKANPAIPPDCPVEFVPDDPNVIKIKGVSEPILIDGTYIKLISLLNRLLPQGSRRRDFLKKCANLFSR